MKALAIDTSTFVMGIALVEEEKVLGEVITNLKKNHSIRVMPAIEALMKDVGVLPNELEKIIVAYGPGSYTGLRIGVTIAKTLAATLKIPLVGVSSLEVMAQNGRLFDGVVAPIIDARRGQVYTGLYGMKNENYINIEEDRICMIDEWAEFIDRGFEKALFLGNDIHIHRETIQAKLGSKALFGLLGDHNPRPSELARLGLAKEPINNVHLFTPNYIRLAEAETNWLAAQKNNG